MRRTHATLSRRALLAALAAAGAGAAGAAASFGAAPRAATGGARPMLARAIPATGERIPIIGMGSWITLNVGNNKALRDHRLEVVRTFLDRGGSVIDSSPMYGSSEAVIGYCLERIPDERALFSATKVWTWGRKRGVRQMADSRRLWGIDRFDLMQIHNLLGWEAHLETLLEHKAQGRVRYIGITTSHGRRHEALEKVMTAEPVDFVQFTYNMLDREAEERLLPLAAERGLAVIINRPFRRGALFDRFERHPLPEWAAEFDCANWAQFFLKFIVSHPAVTCTIPATSRVDHMEENMGTLYGRLPDQDMRRRMIRHVESL